MKKYFLFLSILTVVVLGNIEVSAQCDRNQMSPIRCGYYDEGYQDGVADGNSNRQSDYRRYRNKFESQYENNYRSGYEAGYDSVRPSTRWTSSQRNAYDAGYDIGQRDRRSGGQAKAGEAYRGGYDQNIGLYFQQGYNDGYANRGRQYNVPVGDFPSDPGGGGSSTASWSGRVDDRANIVIRGRSLTAENVSGNGVQTTYQNMNAALPRRATTVRAMKSDGRGDVTVIQQPNRGNNFTAIVQIYDRSGGAGNYRVDFSWEGGAIVEEPYERGSVRWRGRVDQTTNIVISGSDVQTQDVSGQTSSNVRFDMNGYLAQRPGSVSVRKRDGRGNAVVIQQPSRNNDFTAIVQIFDPSGGADDYDLEITW